MIKKTLTTLGISFVLALGVACGGEEGITIGDPPGGQSTEDLYAVYKRLDPAAAESTMVVLLSSENVDCTDLAMASELSVIVATHNSSYNTTASGVLTGLAMDFNSDATGAIIESSKFSTDRADVTFTPNSDGQITGQVSFTQRNTGTEVEIRELSFTANECDINLDDYVRPFEDDLPLSDYGI